MMSRVGVQGQCDGQFVHQHLVPIIICLLYLFHCSPIAFMAPDCMVSNLILSTLLLVYCDVESLSALCQINSTLVLCSLLTRHNRAIANAIPNGMTGTQPLVWKH